MTQPTTPSVSPIQKQLLADLTKKITALKNDFAQAELLEPATIPEGIFVRDFLPLFSGKDTSNREALLANWYLIAGSPYASVNIVDQFGTLVIKVPAILDRDAITIPTARGNNFLTVFEEAKQRSAISPSLGDSIINAELQNRLNNMVSTEGPKGMSAEWTQLLRHYKVLDGAKPAAQLGAGESDFEMD